MNFKYILAIQNTLGLLNYFTYVFTYWKKVVLAVNIRVVLINSNNQFSRTKFAKFLLVFKLSAFCVITCKHFKDFILFKCISFTEILTDINFFTI